jgi:hypothetical protein
VVELAEGEELIAEKKQAKKHAKSKLARKNAERLAEPTIGIIQAE